MRCPRCHEETGHAAIRCADCGAPLVLADEPPARPLDRPLDLDRRLGRTDPDEPPEPSPPASTPGPAEPRGQGAPAGSAAPPRPAPPAPPRAPLSPASAEDLQSSRGAPLLAMPPPGTVLTLRRGGSGRRVLAWLVDGVPFALAAAGLIAWLGADDLRLVAQLLAVVGLASFTYQTLALGLLGATLGKRLLGLRVVGPDGQRPGPGRSALRAGLAVVGVALLGIGPLLALFTLSGRALHDLAAGTAVVEAP